MKFNHFKLSTVLLLLLIAVVFRSQAAIFIPGGGGGGTNIVTYANGDASLKAGVVSGSNIGTNTLDLVPKTNGFAVGSFTIFDNGTNFFKLNMTASECDIIQGNSVLGQTNIVMQIFSSGNMTCPNGVLTVSSNIVAKGVYTPIVNLAYSDPTNVYLDANLGTRFMLAVTNTVWITPTNFQVGFDKEMTLSTTATNFFVYFNTNTAVSHFKSSGGVLPITATNGSTSMFVIKPINNGTNGFLTWGMNAQP